MYTSRGAWWARLRSEGPSLVRLPFVDVFYGARATTESSFEPFPALLVADDDPFPTLPAADDVLGVEWPVLEVV